MTGRRPSRGGASDPWRGGRPARPDDADAGDVELEDLPASAVQRRRKGGVSSSAALAAVALVALLAVGFGVLGGRAERLPDPTAGAGAAQTAGEPIRTPAVTPFRECRSMSDQAPEILFGVDGVFTPGQVALVTPGSNPTPGPRDRIVQIPADATTELWISGDACAHAWRISMSSTDGDRLIPIELRSNPTLDPEFASQNRFDLALAEHRLETGYLGIRAALDFPEMALVVTWPIRFLEPDRP